MYHKLSTKELVDIIWEIRDIPELFDQLNIAELKQLNNFLLDWHNELWMEFSKKLIESKYDITLRKNFNSNNSKYGFSFSEIETWLKKIKEKVDPLDLENFKVVLGKFSEQFECKFPTTKYTIIYHWMKSKNMMPLFQNRYMTYVRDTYLNGTKFKRLAFDSVYDKKYIENESTLDEIYKT